MSDLIDRQAAIDDIARWSGYLDEDMILRIQTSVKKLPSAQPTLYGYKIEHLALIATVMQKKEITAEKAVEIFSDIGCVATMLIEEIQNKVDEEMERWVT